MDFKNKEDVEFLMFESNIKKYVESLTKNIEENGNISIDFNKLFIHSNIIIKRYNKSIILNRIKDYRSCIFASFSILDNEKGKQNIKNWINQIISLTLIVIILKNSLKNKPIFFKDSKDYNYFKEFGLNIYIDSNKKLINFLNGDGSFSNNTSFFEEFIY